MERAPTPLLLHLSDLHFGNKNRFSAQDMTSLGKAFAGAILHAKAQAGINSAIHLAIVSGDIAETGDRDEFTQAAAFLDSLAGTLGIDPHMFSFIPGNHDVSWPLCEIQCLTQKLEKFDSAALRKRIDDVKFTYFYEFLDKFYGRQLSDLPGRRRLECGAWLHDDKTFKISLGLLNTCEAESHRYEDHRGYLSEQQAESLMTAWRDPSYDDWMKIAVVHHNPIATTPANVDEIFHSLSGSSNYDSAQLARYAADVVGFDGRDLLNCIVRNCHVHLVLHGHHHDQGEAIEWPWDSDGRAPILSTGSWGLDDNQLPGDALPSCQLLWVAEANGQFRLESYPLVYDGRFRLDGDLLLGNFILDPAQRGRYRQIVSLSPKWHGDVPPPSGGVLDDSLIAFMRRYRSRMKSLFERWDLRYTGLSQGRAEGRPIDTHLDEIYQPLRLADGYTTTETNRGHQFGVDAIKARFNTAQSAQCDASAWQAVSSGRMQALVIRGSAGSGKTTWMRYTYRRLLEDEETLPLIIVLRDLATRWSEKNCVGPARSIDTFLDDWIAEHLGTGWNGQLRALLQQTDLRVGPRIVLLVDGWDELGPFGNEFREKLRGFSNEYLHVLIVASSRPYGEGRPTNSDGFESLDIQPLSTTEVSSFAERFFEVCYGKEATEARQEAERFCEAVYRSPEPAQMAENVMLLLMMLFVSRTERLPEKRHLLYDRCIGNLLTAREQRGILLSADQWRPDDSELSLQVVASLAYSVQSAGYVGRERSAIDVPWCRAIDMLPQEWEESQRNGFLAWLCGSTGILIDRADGTVVFSHLSFQEFLAAAHLNATVLTTEDVSRKFYELIHDRRWWETLLLWSARINGQNRGRCQDIMKMLLLDEDGFWLTGMMLAEGSGSIEMCDSWAGRLAEKLSAEWPNEIDDIIRRWKNSREDARRNQIREILLQTARKAGWLSWIRIEEVLGDLSCPHELTLSENVAAASVIDALLTHPPTDRRERVAGGRILCGAAPFWPGQPSEVAMLQIWPSRRRLVGLRLQNAIACGADERELQLIAECELRRQIHEPALHYPDAELIGELGSDLAHRISLDLSKYWSQMWPNCSVSGWAQDWSAFWLKLWRADAIEELNSGTAIRLETTWARDLAKHSSTAENWDCNWGANWARSWVTDWSLGYQPCWLEDFARSEFLSWNRGVSRSYFGAARTEGTAIESLLAISCRIWHAAQLNRVDSTLWQSFEKALERCDDTIDKLWIALGRYLAGRASKEEINLLVNVARYPEMRQPPMSIGLQFVVRGDLLLADGRVLTLDEICERSGLPAMPYIDTK